MLNICLVGYGKWGKLLYKKLIEITKVKKILNSKNYSLKKLDSIDWIVIATPDNTHYKIIKDCLKQFSVLSDKEKKKSTIICLKTIS